MRARNHVSRGFTLVELLAVVAMIGILSALAVVGYRKYLHSAQTGDARAIVASIRISQENYRAETLTYLNCSPNGLNAVASYYPGDPTVVPRVKRHWRQPGHGDFGCWSILNVTSDSATYFGFATTAGPAGTTPDDPATNVDMGLPAQPSEPWYMVRAVADLDEDGTTSLFVSSSFSGEIYAENEAE
jgi:type IV pilus assembly protein PilA